MNPALLAQLAEMAIPELIDLGKYVFELIQKRATALDTARIEVSAVNAGIDAELAAKFPKD